MRLRMVAIASVLGLSAQMAACGDAGNKATRKGEWQSVCLDRLLLDIPMPAEMGATGAAYKDGFGFDGVDDIGGRGMRWGGGSVVETFPTDLKGYEFVRAGVGNTLASPKAYESSFRANDRKIKSYEARLPTASPDGRIFALSMIDEAKRDIAETHRSQKVSGFAKLSDANAFAIRDDDNYILGHLDPVDKRVRIFEGKLSHPEIESPEAAADEYRRFARIYHRRAPTDIPTTPGYCTGYGFLDEPAGHVPAETDSLHLPFRSLKYPNLVFFLIVSPANPNGPRDVKQLRDPNVVTMEDIKGLKGMAAVGALAAMGNIKKAYGPKPAEMAGQPGRILGREYRNNGYLEENGSGSAYEIEAEVLGEPGRTDRPHIKLQLPAALADNPKLPPGQKPIRPVLKGHQPPPFDEALGIFKEVLKSVRVRPVTTGAGSSAGSK